MPKHTRREKHWKHLRSDTDGRHGDIQDFWGALFEETVFTCDLEEPVLKLSVRKQSSKCKVPEVETRLVHLRKCVKNIVSRKTEGRWNFPSKPYSMQAEREAPSYLHKLLRFL